MHVPLKRIVRFLLPVILLGAGLAGFFLLKIETPEVVPEIPTQPVWRVNAQEVQLATLTPSVNLFGRVVVPGRSHLSSILEAEVTQVNVVSGQSVEAGEVLIRLDNRNIVTQLKQLEADVARIDASLDREAQRLMTDQEILVHEVRLRELATDSLIRVETLKSRNLASQAEFDAAERAEQQARLAVTARRAAVREYDSRVAELEAGLLRAQASVEKAQRDLEDSLITAPYAGRIIEVNVAVGGRVSKGSPLVTLYDHTRTEIRTLIPNRHLAALRELIANHNELKADARLDGRRIPLKFDRLATTVDPGRGGVDAFFRIGSGPHYPELGRSIDLWLALAPISDAVAVPYSAVYGSNQVFKVEDERLKAVTIERYGQLQLEGESYFVATSADLQRGDRLVITQLTNAIQGLKVQIWNAE